MNNEELIEFANEQCEIFREDSAMGRYLRETLKMLQAEPCEMTTEEYRQRMMQAFQNANCDELIAVCVLPTEKEFEHLEWLLKNHYKKEPCEDAISRTYLLKKFEDRFIELQKAHQKEKQLGINWCINTLKDMPPIKPTQNWIPVSERLPSVKNYQRKYLVTLKDKTICDAMFTECDGEHWWNYNYDDVIAWMPLPKPYKGSEEE